MQRVMIPWRQLTAAGRTGQRATLQAPVLRCAPVLLDERRPFSSAKPAVAEAAARDSRAMTAAYTRIASKMGSLFKNKQLEVHEIEEEIKRIVKYLEMRLGMSKVSATRTIALHPMMTSYSSEMMDRKLEWLERNGVDPGSLGQVIMRHPQIMGRSEETLEATKEWFIARGVNPSKISFLFTVFPQAPSYALDTLDAKVETLREMGLDDEHIRRVLQRFPQVLTSSAEHMLHKVQVARDLGVKDEEVVKLVTAVPEFLALSMEKVKAKLKTLDRLFGTDSGVRLWMSMPRVIMTNNEQLQRSFEYLTTTVGVPRDRIASRIALAMRNVDRITRPRFEYLKEIRSPELESYERWIMMTESAFVERYPMYSAFLQNEYQA